MINARSQVKVAAAGAVPGLALPRTAMLTTSSEQGSPPLATRRALDVD